MEKLDMSEQLRIKLRKWFPATKDMTEKQLKKEIKSNRRLQLIMLLTALLFASFFVVVPVNKLEVFDRMAFIGIVTGGIAMEFAIYVMYRVAELEASFELRLREVIATKP
jgi:hypothetical protein